jgi:hypothetical protein
MDMGAKAYASGKGLELLIYIKNYRSVTADASTAVTGASHMLKIT